MKTKKQILKHLKNKFPKNTFKLSTNILFYPFYNLFIIFGKYFLALTSP